MLAGEVSPRISLAGLAGVGDDDVALGDTALLLAALQHPAARLDSYRGHFDTLAETALGLGGLDAAAHAAALGEAMGRHHGYRCDDRDDDDLGNANLIDVIDQRRGIPEALAVLAIEAARRAGWRAEPLAFPLHVLVRLEDEDGRRVILDPAAAGAVLDAPALRALLKAAAGIDAELEPCHYAPLSNRDMLLRLHNAAKLRLLRAGRVDRALATVEAMLLFAPDRDMLWREAGMMHLRLDNLRAAIAALEQFAARTANRQARTRTLALLAEIKARMN
ncbi:MAG: tetratricopeptide repeat protein [Actinomycetota bacterium]